MDHRPPRAYRPHAKPLVYAAILLGAGLGAFVDGIVFHQILQWHHIASSHPDPAIANDLGLNLSLDGAFHALAWVLVAMGLMALQRAWSRDDVPRSARVFVGSMLAGWGIFQVVEGLVDHHILGIHHVHPSGALLWDVAFLASGAALLLLGWGLAASDAGVRARRGARSRGRAV